MTTLVSTDFLQFEGGTVMFIPKHTRLAMFHGTPLQDTGAMRVGWDGANGGWPPPQRMGVAFGRTTGIVKVFNPDDQDIDFMPHLGRVARVTIYRLVSASKLPPQPLDGHVARGALYKPE